MIVQFGSARKVWRSDRQVISGMSGWVQGRARCWEITSLPPGFGSRYIRASPSKRIH